MKRVRLGVTEVADFSCPRRIAISYLMANLDIRSEFRQSAASLKGKILHSVLQDTFIRHFDYVKYFYHGSHSAVDALDRAMQVVFQSWNRVLTSKDSMDLSRQIIVDALTSAEDEIYSLGKVSEGALYESEDGIESLAVSDEYSLVLDLDELAILVGKVDLLLYRNNRLVVVELKTGRRYDTDEWQLQLYGDMIASNHGSSEDIQLELWYPRTREIVAIDHTKGRSLEGLKKTLLMAQKVESASELPERKSGSCGFCRLCDLVGEIFKRLDRQT